MRRSIPSTWKGRVIDLFGAPIPTKIVSVLLMRLEGDQNMVKFPNDKELKSIRKQMAKVKGSQSLSSHATPLDRAKYEACEQILIFMQKKKLNQRELAKALSASETRVSEIVHYRIEKFTLDRLVAYLQIVKPMMSLHVA